MPDVNDLLNQLNQVPQSEVSTYTETSPIADFLDGLGESMIKIMPFLGSDTDQRREEKVGMGGIFALIFIGCLLFNKKKPKRKYRRRSTAKRSYKRSPRRRTYRRRK